MLRIATALSALLFVYASAAFAQQADRPPNLNVGDAIVTGFSGVVAPDPAEPLPANKRPADFTFINPDGPSARVIDLNRPGYVWDGRLWQAPKKFDVLARDVGQVFGVAIDDQNPPNFYLAATSAFGLNIVIPGRGREGAQRGSKGRRGAVWMEGQFGLERQGGPGSIWRVDGRSGQVSLLANVMLEGAENPGPGLGNLAYDSVHKQLFVSDLHTGMIHRIGLDGRDLGFYDHGAQGRPANNLPPAMFDPRRRPDITNSQFDSGNPDTWGFAQPARRVWGVAVDQDRLYYSVAEGPQIWSVGIQPDGSFTGDARWEIDLPAQPGPYAVSDITFSLRGAMILAQRGAAANSYNYSAFTAPGEPRVLRYWPNPDQQAPSRWTLEPEEYAVGFAGNFRNANGGVDLGYGYRDDGALASGACEFSLWATGQNLRNNPAFRSQLEPGGPLAVHGLQGSPAGPVRSFNEPPATSYFVDYDDKFDDPRATGRLGGIRILRGPCAEPVGGPGFVSAPPYLFDAAASAPGWITCMAPLVRTRRGDACTCPPGRRQEGGDCLPYDCPPPKIMTRDGRCICPPPMVQNREGQCVCPEPFVTRPDGTCGCREGTTWNGRRCVPVNECKEPQILGPDGQCICPPPMVTGPVPGMCVCPQGGTWNGRRCVPVDDCKAPQIMGPDGQCICPPPMVTGPVPGMCVCPQGMALQDGQCRAVIQIQTCPGGTERRGNACVPIVVACPEGSVRQRGECVPVRERERVREPRRRVECDDGQVLRRGKCVAVRERVQKRVRERERRQIECGAGTVKRGGKCVRVRERVQKRKPVRERERGSPQIRPFGGGGGFGGGGFGGGGRGGGGGRR
jgi:hypothetical protein